MRKRIEFFVIVLFVSTLGFSQTVAPKEQPLAIKSVGTDPTNFSYTVTNVSGKDVRAYTLSIKFIDINGAVVSSNNKTAIRGLGPGGATVYKPGEIMAGNLGRLRVSGGIRAYAGTLDYVLFADGTSWGPDKFKTSLEIQGMLNGRRAALEGLKDMLARQGPDAVVTYLNGNQ